MVESIITYAKWVMHIIEGNIIDGEAGHWQSYLAAIQRLKTLMEGSNRKRCMAAKTQQLAQKRREDIQQYRYRHNIDYESKN